MMKLRCMLHVTHATLLSKAELVDGKSPGRVESVLDLNNFVLLRLIIAAVARYI